MPLSRLQLAAALLEYDNDNTDDPSARVDHRRSAVFADIVRRDERRRASRLTTIPPTAAEREVLSRASARPPSRALDNQDARSARGGVYAPGPIGERDLGDRMESVDPVGGQGDVDVSRWGLPEHLISEDLSRPTSAMSTQDALPLRPPSVAATTPRERTQSLYVDRADGPRDVDRLRRASMDADAMLRALPPRRPSLDVLGAERRRSAIGGLVLDDDEYARTRRPSNPVMVPLPSSPPAARARRLSRLSAYSYGPSDLLDDGGRDAENDADDEDADDEPNPFALPPPPPELGSRFDPKTLVGQRQESFEALGDARAPSRGSMLSHRASFDSRRHLDDALTADADAARIRTHSQSSAGDFEVVHRPAAYDDVPTAEEYGRPLRPSKYGPRQFVDRNTLLRPKTLVMPSPLAGIEPHTKTVHVPSGFSYGDKPLPAGARSSILSMGRKVGEIGAGAGGPGGMPMSLSQRTFRSSLMVDGRRDDGFLGEAEEGDIVYDEDGNRDERRPGKLYGTSLIDQLEARKTELRSKQRVFKGDSRPSMMQRPSDRPSTLIDPATLADPPTGLASPQTSPTRPASLAVPASRESVYPNDARMTKSRSVFGVDHLWERDMEKLKVIQGAEARARAAQQERDREAEARVDARRKSRMSMIFPASKSTNRMSTYDVSATEQHPSDDRTEPSSPPEISPVARLPDLPPALQYSPEKAIPSTRGFEDKLDGQRRSASRAGLGWDDSDDDAPVRRDKGKGRALASPPAAAPLSDSDDDDVPLSRLRPAIAVRPADASDSDSDVPLSTIKARSVRSPHSAIASPALTLPDTQFGSGSLGLDLAAASMRSVSAPVSASAPKVGGADDGDDDDEPLFHRQARARAASHALGGTGTASPLTPADEAEDDLPLGWKHAGAAQRQQAETARQQAEAAWWEGQRAASMMGYGAPWAVPGMPPMPGMGPMGPMGPMMPMGHALPPMPHLAHMASMASLPGAFGVPPFMPVPPADALGPGRNIDDWRKEVALVPATTGSGRTVSSGGR